MSEAIAQRLERGLDLRRERGGARRMPSGLTLSIHHARLVCVRHVVQALLWPLLLAVATASAASEAPLHYDLQVRIDAATRRLEAKGTVTIPAGRQVTLDLDDRFQIRHFSTATPASSKRGQRSHANRRFFQASEQYPLRVTFEYTGYLAPMDLALDHRQVLAIEAPLLSSEGAFLPAGSGWYPQPDRGRMTYRIEVQASRGLRPVVPGNLVQETVAAQRASAVFETRDPLPGIDLLAGPYRVQERVLKLPSGRSVRLRTYFHPDLEALAARYLDAASRHLRRYDAQIGPYAFPAYSIVSSPLPVGFGMPGIAYLGNSVLKLPFIPATSLRHEVLHDWWGNGIVPDYGRGNWAEGLTTLLADHAQRAEQGAEEAQALRRSWLRDYAAVPVERDHPLARFVSRRHGADQAIGYHKSAFVFFMLRDRIGAERFRAGLQRFWRAHRFGSASWEDLRKAFEQEGAPDLKAFFAQWIDRPGAPRLALLSAQNVTSGDGTKVRFVLRQQGEPYRLRVPLRILHARGFSEAKVEIDGPETSIDLAVPAPASAIQIDPEARLFRQLDPEEIAPTLREVFFDPRTRVALAVSDASSSDAAMRVAASILESEVRRLDLASRKIETPLLVIGLHAEVQRVLGELGLAGRSVPHASKAAAFAYADRTAGGRPFAVVSAGDAEQLALLTRSLPHLGARSFATFAGPRSVERGIWTIEPKRYPVRD